MLTDNIMDYYFVAQGKTTIPGVDDAEELTLTDVRLQNKTLLFCAPFLGLKYSKILDFYPTNQKLDTFKQVIKSKVFKFITFFSTCNLKHFFMNLLHRFTLLDPSFKNAEEIFRIYVEPSCLNIF